jgi:hypothetical protein
MRLSSAQDSTLLDFESVNSLIHAALQCGDYLATIIPNRFNGFSSKPLKRFGDRIQGIDHLAEARC